MKSTTKKSPDCIQLRGARQHNLKGINLDLPLHQLSVICGVSGSGKSTLAFDTLYAEGQRRFIESFSAYTRQFLERIEKPKFDSLEPLPPSIAITRDARSRNNRSTVGTATEILEYLRTVFAQRADIVCYSCGQSIQSYKPESIGQALQGLADSRCMIGFAVRWESPEELACLLADLQSMGFVRLVVGSHVVHLGETERASMVDSFRHQTQAIVVVDRLKWSGSLDERWSQSITTAYDQCYAHSPHQVVVFSDSDFERTNGAYLNEVRKKESEQHNPSSKIKTTIDDTTYFELRFPTSFRCELCQIDFPEPDASLFNFNHPLGACASCEGFGETISIDPDKVVPDKSLTLRQGAIAPWRTSSYAHELQELISLADDYGIPVDIPVSELKPRHWKLIEDGVPDREFGGLKGFFAWLERHKYKMHVRVFLSRWRSYHLCELCQGDRLSRESLSYRWQGKNFAELCKLSISDLRAMLDSALTGQSPASDGIEANRMFLASERHAQYNAAEPVRQLASRLEYLEQVGLGYLSLDRPMHTLSSGEAQRVNLTSLLGSTLVDMLYVFDEPTVGLHRQDVARIAQAILSIRDRGNTVILVEHEPAMIRMADRIIEIGPGAGVNGGEVVFDGTPQQLEKSRTTTGKYLRGDYRRRHRRHSAKHWLRLHGASGRNLKQASLAIPLGCLTIVTGPSGSGKSSLLLDTLVPAINQQLGDDDAKPLQHESIEGLDRVARCLALDQAPIPRSTRSTPATYCKAMDAIRDVFAGTSQAKSLQFTASHFSFNSEQGRCATCEGLGYTTVEMQFMADLSLPCGDCLGKRYKPQVLTVTVRDRNIHDVLQLSVDEAIEFFRGENLVQERLKLLSEIGIGYLPLGQSLATLSAGESMRLKLASVLSQSSPSSKSEIVVMDEPTTGLHFADIDKLIHCFEILLERGKTVVVIEHNDQLIEAADYRIELGPGAGPTGGQVVASYWAE